MGFTQPNKFHSEIPKKFKLSFLKHIHARHAIPARSDAHRDARSFFFVT